MSENKRKWTKRKIFQFAALFLFLAGFPAVSWYYLNTGLNWRIKALSELQEYGKIPAFSLTDYDGDTLSSEYLSGSITIFSFLSLENDELAATYGENLRRLHLQFDERPDLMLVNFTVDTMEYLTGRVSAYTVDYELTDGDQCYFLNGPAGQLEEMARQGFKIPLEAGKPLVESPYLIMADTSGMIRHYYDVRNAEEVKRLVEHVAIILPQIKERDLVFQREKEK